MHFLWLLLLAGSYPLISIRVQYPVTVSVVLAMPPMTMRMVITPSPTLPCSPRAKSPWLLRSPWSPRSALAATAVTDTAKRATYEIVSTFFVLLDICFNIYFTQFILVKLIICWSIKNFNQFLISTSCLLWYSWWHKQICFVSILCEYHRIPLKTF
jgi:hypothetical protein